MGGYGSGRKVDVYSGTVENCLQIDVNRLVRDGSIGSGRQAIGTLTWKRHIGVDSSIAFEAVCYAESGHIELQYTFSSLATGSQPISYTMATVNRPM